MVTEQEIRERFGKPTGFFSRIQCSQNFASGYATPVDIVDGDGVVFSKGRLVVVEGLEARNCVTGRVDRRYTGRSMLKLEELTRLSDS